MICLFRLRCKRVNFFVFRVLLPRLCFGMTAKHRRIEELQDRIASANRNRVSAVCSNAAFIGRKIRLVDDLQATLLGDIRLDARSPAVAPVFKQVDRIAFEQQGNVRDEVLVPARLRAEPVVERVYRLVSERPDLLLRLPELGGHLVGRQARNFAADVPFIALSSI